MSDQDRWSEDRYGGAWSRDDGRNYGDQGARYGADRNGPEGGGRYGRAGGGDDRSGGYGLDRYGVPADYNFGGPETSASGQGGRVYAAAGGGEFGSNRYGYGAGGSGQRYRGGYDRSERDFGSDRYQLADSRRPGEERSWWSQTRDEVSSWFGDDEAARRRQQDDLRAGEHRGKGPKGYTRSDERIREDVNDRLTDHPGLDASDIEVGVAGSEVTLNGTVRQRQDKRYAEDVADRVSGVKHVQNNLRVRDDSAQSRSDSYGAATAASTAGQASSTAQTRTN